MVVLSMKMTMMITRYWKEPMRALISQIKVNLQSRVIHMNRVRLRLSRLELERHQSMLTKMMDQRASGMLMTSKAGT
jgi:hypothetical protein